jgi:hypothetical protein
MLVAGKLKPPGGLAVERRSGRDQQPSARQRMLQLLNRDVRGRRAVRLFDVFQKRLQVRVLVSNDPPTREHLGFVQARNPDHLGRAGKPGIEIIIRGRCHSVTKLQFAIVQQFPR